VSEADGDRIEREILIDAPIERVWRLVSEPGWWIGDGDRSQQTVTRDGDSFVVHDPRYGSFEVLPVGADEPHHVSFRSPWAGGSTLVEFFLTATTGGTLLRVVESGFGSLDLPDDGRAGVLDDNTKGWAIQLGIAKTNAERA
jgi:uncharacterized protein YndB with AHSA1/START domain